MGSKNLNPKPSLCADPLTYHGNTRARNASEFLRVTEDLVASMPAMDFPFVVFHGERDTLCDLDGSRQLFEKSAVRFAAPRALGLGVRVRGLRL